MFCVGCGRPVEVNSPNGVDKVVDCENCGRCDLYKGVSGERIRLFAREDVLLERRTRWWHRKKR